MSTIHMNTEQVHALARKIQISAQSAGYQAQAFRACASNLPYVWTSDAQMTFSGELEQTARLIQQHVEALDQLGRAVSSEVAQWEEVDRSFTGINGGGVWGDHLTLPSIDLLPATGGGWALSPITGISIPPIFAGIFDDLGFDLPEWLRRLIGLPNPPLVPNLTPENPKPGIGFGELIEQARKEEEARRAAEEAAQAAPGTGGYDVPVMSQGRLYGNAACLPTCISMVLQYLHAQDPNMPTVSPEDLISMLDPGDGTRGSGITFDKLNDDLAELGITNTEAKAGASLDELKEQLLGGPVIVATGVNISGSGDNRSMDGIGATIHAIVVKGFSEDGQKVLVNDPWSGTAMEIDLETFQKMWDKGSNATLTIRP